MFEIQSKTGLLTYMFYSVNKKLIFCKVGATIDRIKKAADELDYNMLLDEHYLATEVDNGEFPVQDEPDISLMKPYECIYGPYERGKRSSCNEWMHVGHFFDIRCLLFLFLFHGCNL